MDIAALTPIVKRSFLAFPYFCAMGGLGRKQHISGKISSGFGSISLENRSNQLKFLIIAITGQTHPFLAAGNDRSNAAFFTVRARLTSVSIRWSEPILFSESEKLDD
jgi:hypothetical protein